MTGVQRLVALAVAFGTLFVASVAHAQSSNCTTFVSSGGTPTQMCYENGQWVGAAASSTASTQDVSGLGAGDGGGGGGGENPLSKLPLDKLTSLFGGAGGKPHPTCVAWVQMPKRPPPPPCFEPSPNGTVAGICQLSTMCLGKSAPGLDGAMGGIGQQLSQLLQSIFGQAGGGSPGAEAGAGGFGNANSGYPACALNPATNKYVTLPCTDSTGALIFTDTDVFGANGATDFSFDSSLPTPASGVADTLVSMLGKGGSAIGQLTGIANAPQSASDALEMLVKSPQVVATPVQQALSNANYSSTHAEKGSVIVGSGGVATIVATKRTYNTVTSGFIGATGSSENQTTLVGRACTASQWGVISFVFGGFFGDLCKSQGY